MAQLPPLFPWQQRELAQHGKDPKRALFASPRLGKTRVTIEAMLLWGAKRNLVVAPLVVCPQWEAQLAAAGFRTINFYSGTAQSRLRRLSGDGVVVANYDCLRTLVDDLMAWRPTAVVGDESHLLKGPKAQRAKSFRRLAWRADYVRLLTGTPTPNHYGDLWGQLVALDPDYWGKSYEKFARRYLIRDSMFPTKVLGHINVEELQRRILRFATIVRREDAFGPDSWQTVTRTVTLPPKARNLYDKLAKDWILNSEGVSADHVLKRLVRLQQLSSGFLPTDSGDILEVHSAKVEAVLEDLDEIVESGEKAVLFHRFRWESETYLREITKRFGPIVTRIWGDTSAEDRQRYIADFAGPGPRVMVVQTQAGGVGISLASATHALFTSRGFSFTEDEQARDRVYSPGARRCVTYYECDRTVDRFAAGILARKQNVHDSVTQADRQAMAFGYL